MNERFLDELAERFHFETPASRLLSLFVAGAAIGTSCSINTGLGENHSACLNLLFCPRDDFPSRSAIHALLFPLRQIQAALLNHGADAIDSIKESLELLKKQKQAFFQNEAHHDPNHLKYFSAEAEKLESALAPLFLLEDPLPGKILPAVTQRFDNAVAAIWSDPAILKLFTAQISKVKDHMELELMRRSWKGQNYDLNYLKGFSDVVLPHPKLDILMVCKRALIPQILLNPKFLNSGISGQFTINVDMGNPVILKPGMAEQCRFQESWNELINRLYLRRSRSRQVVTLTTEARLCVLPYLNSLRDQIGRVNTHLQQFTTGLEALVWRLMLIQHLCDSDPEKQVSPETAVKVIQIASYCVSHHLAAIEVLPLNQAAQERKNEEDRMLEKIRAHGPISRRKLYRLYKVQRYHIHEPILRQLLQQGKIVEDQDAQFRIAQPPKTVICKEANSIARSSRKYSDNEGGLLETETDKLTRADTDNSFQNESG